MTTSGQPEAPIAGWVADDSTFGARLALIRQKMGWGNIAKAAKECGLPADSWRNWEVDGREPHRIVTVSMAISSRTNCDQIWLVHGPNRGEIRRGVVNERYQTPLVLATIDPDKQRSDASRPVRQTRPLVRVSSRPLTPIAV